MTERIVAAAIRENGVVYTGPHHAQIIRYLVPLLGIRTVKGEQGFVTSEDRFVDRITAACLAHAAGQTDHPEGPLYSEQLWIVPDAMIAPTWLPTAENINALPEPVRRFVMELETRADPAGDVRARILAEDQVRQLSAALAREEGPGECGAAISAWRCLLPKDHAGDHSAERMCPNCTRPIRAGVDHCPWCRASGTEPPARPQDAPKVVGKGNSCPCGLAFNHEPDSLCRPQDAPADPCERIATGECKTHTGSCPPAEKPSEPRMGPPDPPWVKDHVRGCAGNADPRGRKCDCREKAAAEEARAHLEFAIQEYEARPPAPAEPVKPEPPLLNPCNCGSLEGLHEWDAYCTPEPPAEPGEREPDGRHAYLPTQPDGRCKTCGLFEGYWMHAKPANPQAATEARS